MPFISDKSALQTRPVFLMCLQHFAEVLWVEALCELHKLLHIRLLQPAAAAWSRGNARAGEEQPMPQAEAVIFKHSGKVSQAQRNIRCVFRALLSEKLKRKAATAFALQVP